MQQVCINVLLYQVDRYLLNCFKSLKQLQISFPYSALEKVNLQFSSTENYVYLYSLNIYLQISFYCRLLFSMFLQSPCFEPYLLYLTYYLYVLPNFYRFRGRSSLPLLGGTLVDTPHPITPLPYRFFLLGLGRIWFFLPDAGYPAFIAGYAG